MSRPKILDLFCCAGGAAMGYYRAGFDVVGVDIEPQPNYPFKFYEYDALNILDRIVRERSSYWNRREFQAIHASPPCQRYSVLAKLRPDKEYPNLVGPVRRLLRQCGVPYVIENVRGAPLHRPIGLCGSMFGLGVPEKGLYLERHRLFECSFPIEPPGQCQHRGKAIGVYGHTDKTRRTWDAVTMEHRGGYQGTMVERVEAMGIDWMTTDELCEAIPPAYTEYIGKVLIESL